MHSSIIGKVDKARKYAEETERVSITSFKATFHGKHNTYEVVFDLIRQGKLDLAGLLTHRFRLADYKRALLMHAAGSTPHTLAGSTASSNRSSRRPRYHCAVRPPEAPECSRCWPEAVSRRAWP